MIIRGSPNCTKRSRTAVGAPSARDTVQYSEQFIVIGTVFRKIFFPWEYTPLFAEM